VNSNLIYSIMAVFADELRLEVTIRELSKRAKLSYNACHRTIQYLLENNLIILKKFGQASVVSLNKENPKLIPLLSYAVYDRTEKELKKDEWSQAKELLSTLTIPESVSIIFTPFQEPSILIVADSALIDDVEQKHGSALGGNCKLMSYEHYKKAHQKGNLITCGAEALLQNLMR